ncbi:hypothetical protein A2773_02340 [Candidatus Gottesmanbacteria bacterium RIFCSPHIGHO2_01_FULL_39_10]|uniref:Uncharacterized protein n=1 Tax=Candidatus Gottesmanbacteria bacterium RIFCSPHIGHO2_01_FULL_39_10 TaxID=1798375 RepID=A0A1F5ZQE5_9BACT|nr:MAG: hypothetical protein A2773_02340 [Candidatus Gottesmanbacteria bacterium RIFCSPHIGHO2_01_FULL_39_10]
MVEDVKKWLYKDPEKIRPQSLHIQVIADYGGGHSTDHAFAEVRNHFLRFDKQNKLRFITEHPVYAFSTLETGFWISQEGLHSEHKDLVIFSNTAPRGDIKWWGERRQAFVYGILDNGIPVFAVNAGYNLSFVKNRFKCLFEVKVPNVGTQFRSRDYYPEATMAILSGDYKRIGTPINMRTIPDVPGYTVASVDGYGNLKTTIKRSHLSSSILNSAKLKITINGRTHFVLNTLIHGVHGKTGDLCMVVGSSGGKKGNFIEFVRLQGRANEDFGIEGPRDDMGSIKVEGVRS